ncbi:MAG: DUF6103 family protein [Anaerocolumna sp.]
MSMSELKVSFPSEKLEALRFFMDKKELTIEQELKDYLDKTYEKAVPAQVREYVESRMEQVPATQEGQDASSARERPVRQNRRQREQAAAESQTELVPSETPSEDSLEETPGMSMGM